MPETDQLEKLITDLSQRLGFLERILTKMSATNPSFAADYQHAGYAVALEKAEAAIEMLQMQRDRLVEIKAPAVIAEAKEAQLAVAVKLHQDLLALGAAEWMAQTAETASYRERLLVHESSTGGVIGSTEGLLEIALGVVDPKKIGRIE